MVFNLIPPSDVHKSPHLKSFHCLNVMQLGLWELEGIMLVPLVLCTYILM